MKPKGVYFEKNGWNYISVSGSPKERGYNFGYFCAKEFKKIQEMLSFFMMESFGQTWEYFIEEVCKDIKEKSQKDFPEFFEEIEAIADGCSAGGTKTTVDEILTWNFYLSIPYWYSTRGNFAGKEGGAKDRCSAFIAVGDWTSDGKIVCAHNSFADFIDGQYMRTIVDMKPSNGCRMLYQTCACWIWSGTDFFITGNGFIGTETTIGGFNAYENNTPLMFRIRKAMQYGKTLDDFVSFLLDGNSGDYANSWLFGDINKNEILRLELGLKYHKIERTKNGFFVGFNGAYDPKIRNLECVNSGFYDTRRHQGARYVRLNDLMDENKGKINIEIAKQIISDHYDVYLEKNENPCSRTVCSHYELDAREYMSQSDRPKPFSPHGALDGVVVDSNMAKRMSFFGRFGSSCGIPFDANTYFKKYRQWEMFKDYVFDRPSEPWIILSSINKKKVMLTKKRKENSNSKSKRNI